MKKLYFTFIALLVAIAFSSCSKTYTCTCTFADASKNFDVKIEKARRNDAKVICDDYSEFVGNCAIK